MELAVNASTTRRRTTTTLSSTVLVIQDGGVRNGTPTPADTDLDVGFIVALVCFAVGGILLLIGFIKVLVWYVDSRKHEKYSKWWLRQLEHRRHLEEYSIRTGDMASQYSASVHSLTNQGFTHEEEEDAFNQSEQPPGSPVATATQSAQMSDMAAGGGNMGSLGSLAKVDGMGVGMGMSNGRGVEIGMNRQDKNMNEIMDYL